jgi:DNA gyrase subunit A
VTHTGVTKKVHINQFGNVRRSGLIAIRLKSGDLLKWVAPGKDKQDIMLVSKLGQAIRFKQKNLRPMGRPAAGVRGIKLKKNDEVVGMCIIDTSNTKLNNRVLVVMENGYGKMTKVNEYRSQTRGGTGIKTAAITDKTGKLVTSFALDPQQLPEGLKGDLIIISEKGQVIRLPLKSVPTLGRSTQGVRLMKFKETADKVASVTLV